MIGGPSGPESGPEEPEDGEPTVDTTAMAPPGSAPGSQATRQFPCAQCGAKVEFAPGTDSLRCPYCGQETSIPASSEVIAEIDLMAALADLEKSAVMEDVPSVTCTSCAAHIEPPRATEAWNTPGTPNRIQ